MSSKNQLYTSKLIFNDEHSLLTGYFVNEFITLTILNLDDPNGIYFSLLQPNDINQQQFRDAKNLFRHLKPQNTQIDFQKKTILASDLNQKLIFKSQFKPKSSLDVYDQINIMEAKLNKKVDEKFQKVDEKFQKIEETFKKQPRQKNQGNNQATSLILNYCQMPVMLILMHIFVTYYFTQPIKICEIQSPFLGQLRKSSIKILIGVSSFSFIFYYIQHCLSQKQKISQNQKIKEQMKGKRSENLNFLIFIAILILICVIPYHLYVPKFIDFSSPTTNDVCQYIVSLSYFQQMDIGEKLKNQKLYQTQNKKMILKKLQQEEGQGHQNLLNIIVGYPGVGKTSSILSFMKNRINKSQKKTIALYFNFEHIDQKQIQNYDFIFPMNKNEIKLNNFQIQLNILEILGCHRSERCMPIHPSTQPMYLTHQCTHLHLATLKKF